MKNHTNILYFVSCTYTKVFQFKVYLKTKISLNSINISETFFFQCLLLPLCLSMDADNGDGNLIRDLPCVMRLNQLSCTGAGNAFPKTSIATFIDDNKALLRRMYGELQEPRTVTKTTFTIVRSFGHTR